MLSCASRPSYNPGMSTFQDILVAAQALPTSERVQLIGALWNTVSPEDWASPSDAWIDEIRRRSQEIDEGTMTSRPWNEVRERARQKAGLDG
jgi:putative addiction module component (TIGR02574 family)